MPELFQLARRLRGNSREDDQQSPDGANTEDI
jgi:hypothetical protein